MWCPACQADVAAELSSDGRHFRCARCTLELGMAAGAMGNGSAIPVNSTDAERTARDLLARWSAQSIWDPPPLRGIVAQPELDKPTFPPKPESQHNHSIEETRSINSPANQQSTEGRDTSRLLKRRKKQIRHEAANLSQHPATLPTLPNPEVRMPKTNSWGTTLGQICAYFGIGLITGGTGLVLWSYFGGPAQFAPTGWLVNSLGQMFLFLGVVTLVSQGLEQTTADVAARIETLGRRLMRIEQHHLQNEVRGPHRRQAARSKLARPAGEHPKSDKAPSL